MIKELGKTQGQTILSANDAEIKISVNDVSLDQLASAHEIVDFTHKLFLAFVGIRGENGAGVFEFQIGDKNIGVISLYGLSSSRSPVTHSLSKTLDVTESLNALIANSENNQITIKVIRHANVQESDNISVDEVILTLQTE